MEETEGHVFRNARLLDGTGAKPIAQAWIQTKGNRIEAIETGDHPVPAGYKEIDLEGQTLMPGLIDLHVHVGHHRSEPDAMRYENFSEAKISLLAARDVEISLLGGVTTLRDLGARHGQSTTIRDAVNTGILPGSRVISANESITFTGGHASYEADGIWALRAAIRRQIRGGADVIKIGQSDDKTFPGFTQSELDALCDEAHRLGRRIAVHIDREPGYGMAVMAGVDTVEHGFYPSDETLQRMLEQGTYWVPTITINRGMRSDEHTPERYESNLVNGYRRKGLSAHQAQKRAADMREAFEAFPECFAEGVKMGVKIVTGSDGPRAGKIPMDSLRNEVIKFVQWGMNPSQAIVAATSLAAEALGMEDELGRIQKGYLADLIVLDGDPLRNIEHVDRVLLVMKDGCIYRNELEGKTEEGSLWLMP